MGLTGRRGIFVRIDNLNAIDELVETDNSAISYLTILSPPDLFIDSTEITYSPANPTADVSLNITFIVRNLGEKAVENVKTRLYNGPPGAGGIALMEYIIPALKGKGGYAVTATIYSPNPGINAFYLVADPDNTIAESDESNNTGSRSIEVEGSIGADLSIYSSGISFLLPPNANIGDSFTINATVRNTGSSDIQTEVSFYEGDPNGGGILIGRTTITAPAITSQTAAMNWLLSAGNPIIYVVVDPDNFIAETNEANNIAYRGINTYSTLPDLRIDNADASYYPAVITPRTKLAIEATVRNDGGTAAYSYLALYEGGKSLGNFTFHVSPYIPAYDYTTGTITISNLTIGEHEFYIIADPNNIVGEISEANNRAVLRVTVTAEGENDLYITSEDITFSPPLPLVGEQVNITANVRNSGSEYVIAYVSFYNGNPSAGGQLIRRGSYFIDQGRSMAITAPFIMTSGIPEIYVVVDEDNRVNETDENNNIAFRAIDTYKVDLSVATGDISLRPVMPSKGDTVTVDVSVHSSGLIERRATLKLYEGKLEYGRLIGSQDFIANGRQTILLNFPSYIYPGDGATLTAVIENVIPSEDDLSNNIATVIFGEHIEEGATNEGTDFWIAFQQTYYNTAKIVIQSKYMASANVKGPSFTWKGNVSPGSPAVIPVMATSFNDPYLRNQIISDGAIEDKGIHITSDRDVSVIFHVPMTEGVADDSYLALPTTMIGTEYYFLSYTAWGQFYPSVYVIVATENNTNVSINGNIINMNRGQTYQIKQGAVDHTGTYVKSDKPITFIAGTVCSNITTVPFIRACDSIFEQMLPVSQLGTDYFTAPLYSPGSSDVFRVLAVEGNTEITVKDKYYRKLLILNAGQWTEYENEESTHITSNKPIMVAQFAKGKDAAKVGDPFQMTIIPSDKLKTGYRYYTYPGYEEGDYLTVIAPEPNTAVMLDGGILDTGWLPLPDRGSYLVMPSTEGEHVITADKPVAVYSHGYRDYGSYGYPAGFAIPLGNLKVDNLTLAPSSPTEGQLTEVTALLTNEGDRNVSNAIVRLYNGDPQNGGVQIGADIYYNNVNPKESKTVTFTWDTYGYSGVNNIYVVADPLNTIKESNEADNIAMMTINVAAPLKPDPAVTGADIILSKDIVNEGEIITLSARIKNRGSEVSNIPVGLYLGDPQRGGLLLENNIIRQALALYGEATLNFTFSTINFMDINDLYIVIDPENIIDELIEVNNRAFKQLRVNRKRLIINVATDKSQYQARSDVGINIYIKNEGISPWSGTGVVYIEDINNQRIAQVATFSINDLKPLGIEGWSYRIPITVAKSTVMKDAIAIAYMNFNSILASLGITGKTIDLNSIRMLEFDSAGNFTGEKKARFDKDKGFDLAANPSGRLLWLMDGTTPVNSARYFYLYFDTLENGVKQPSVKTDLPQKGRLIVFSGYWGDLYTVISNADGTFGNQSPVDTLRLSLLNGIDLNDFNNDGFPDIISGDVYGDIYYYQNRADASDTFLLRKKIGNVNPLSANNNILQPITSSDYNNDGNQDFILNMTNSGLYVFLGDGAGAFIQMPIPVSPSLTIRGKTSADFNNDGKIDISVGDNLGVVSIYYGNGDGTFGTPIEIRSIGKDIYGLAVGDVDNDGYLDIIVNGANDGVAYIIKGMAGGIFKPVEQLPSLKTASRAAYSLVDINGDGKLDVIATDYNYPGKLLYFEGSGDGTFKTSVNIPVSMYYATAVRASRINPEVIAANGIPEKIESKVYYFTWNTGATPSGPYHVHVTLSEGQGAVTEGGASFEIAPDTRVGSKVVTDKISYNANEQAIITSTITSLSQNTILKNLTAKITVSNSQGTSLFTDTKTISMLTPGQLTELKSYWNTGANPKGTYTVTLEVFGFAALSTSTAAFEIIGTSNTGGGLRGTISAQPNIVDQGKNATVTYTVTNNGNEDISNLNLKVLIIEPDTNIVKAEFNMQQSISKGGVITIARTVSTVNLAPKIYLAILQASTTVMASPITLASTNFTVISLLKITKEIKGNARVLIWLCKENNEHHESHRTEDECKGETDPLEPIIKEALKQLGIYYYLIVYDKKDFEAQLRSNEFNSYLIFNNHEPIEDHIDEELTEHINAGKGIIAFFIKKEEQHNVGNSDEKDLPIFGIRFKGYLPDEQRTLYLADTEVTDTDTLITSGKVEKTELTDPNAKIMAYFNDGTPAIITNTYGNGKAVLYTFDIRKTTETATAEQLTKLIMKAVKYTAPAKEPIISGGIMPITIKIQSLGTAATLKIEEQLPPNAMIITDSTAIRTGDALSWAINIAANATKELTYYLIAPDAANITLNTGIYYLSTSTSSYELYDTIELKIDIKNSIVQIATAAIEKLNSLTLTDKKAEEDKTEIINILAELQNQTIPADKKDANKIWEEAIKKTLKAIDELIDIKEQLQKSSSLDINTEKTLTEIRLLLDELLMFAEIKWYGSR